MIVDIKLAPCEKKIIYNEFSAAIFVGIEKKKNKTTKLIGPPPIPRNDEIIPRNAPMLKQTDFLSILYVLILDLYKVYKSVPKVMIKRQNAWTAPTFSLFPLTNLTYEKSSLPATPPIEAPIANGNILLADICDVPLHLFFNTE